jgi:hypothetical protein
MRDRHISFNDGYGGYDGCGWDTTAFSTMIILDLLFDCFAWHFSAYQLSRQGFELVLVVFYSLFYCSLPFLYVHDTQIAAMQ